MKLGIISDTHGHLEHTQAGLEVFTNQNVDAIIHCGDIGSPEIVPLFDGWPAHFVFGNVDYHKELMQAAIELPDQTCHGRFGRLQLEGRQIAFLHSDDAALFRQTINCGDYDLVCYGHTHEAKLEQEGNTLVLNPGAITRAVTRSVAIVQLPSLDIEIIPVD